jgi:hypothetical protein
MLWSLDAGSRPIELQAYHARCSRREQPNPDLNKKKPRTMPGLSKSFRSDATDA